LDRPSTATSLAKNNIGDDNKFSGEFKANLKLPNNCGESREISEITKICTSSFNHSMKTKSISDLVCGQPTETYGEDEAAKDCL